MKHIKQDFSLKAWVKSPGVDLGGGARAKITFFSEYGHVAYQIEADNACSNMVAVYFAHRHTLDSGDGLDPRDGVKRSNHFFLKVVMLHIKLKGIEHRAP